MYEITSFSDGIKNFIEAHPDGTAVILDTSVVLETMNELKKLRKLRGKADFYIPETCRYELMLLKNYSKSERRRSKAKYILRSFRYTCKGYDDLIKGYPKVEKYVYNYWFFATNEPLLSIELMRKINESNYPEVHTLFCDKDKGTYKEYTTGDSPLYLAKSTASVPADYMCELSTLSLVDEEGKTVGNLDFGSFIKMTSGGEATIYTSHEIPDRCIKIYKDRNQNSNMIEKLKALIKIGKLISCASFPIHLVYHNDQCVGFTMKLYKGKTLNKLETDEFYNLPEDERLEIVFKLLSALLELRLREIYMVDISGRNIMLTEKKEIVILDIDSCQYRRFAGGGFTPNFSHPDVTAAMMYKKLRSREENFFGLAPTFFYLYTNRNNAFCQKNLDREPNYKDDRFPYANSKFFKKGIELEKNLVFGPYLKRWKKLPYPLRAEFVEIFNFNKESDIGSWTKCFTEIS